MEQQSNKTIFTEHILDYETGELKETRWIKKKAGSKHNFVIMYLDDLSKLSNLSPAATKVLQVLCVFLEYNTNEFYLNAKRKGELVEQTKLSLNTINHSLTQLVKKNLLIRISSGTYQMNPLVFFKGEEIERAKYLDLTIRYTICPDC